MWRVVSSTNDVGTQERESIMRGSEIARQRSGDFRVGVALVIGYGSELRGDDALGPIAARELQSRALPDTCRVLARTCLAPELAAELAAVDLAIFIDASVEGAPGAMEEHWLEPAEGDEGPLGHSLDPRRLLQLSRTLYGRAPRAVLFSAGGEYFEMGDTLSPALRQVIPALVSRVESTLACLLQSDG